MLWLLLPGRGCATIALWQEAWHYDVATLGDARANSVAPSLCPLTSRVLAVFSLLMLQFLQYWYEMIEWYNKKRGEEAHKWDASDFSYGAK